MRIEKHVEIDRTIDDVFAFIRDPNNDPVWCPTVLESTRVEGEGPVPGAIYRQRHKPGPAKPTELTVELLEVDAPHSLELKSIDDLGWFHVWYRLEELPGGRTRLTQIDETHFQGIGKLLQPIMFFAIHTGIKRQFATLKRRLEAEAGGRGAVPEAGGVPETRRARETGSPGMTARPGSAPGSTA